MTEPLPTFTVGVGRGGIEIMRTLADVAERNGQSKFFDYVAIDTDTDSFSDLPEGTTRVELEAPSAYEREDRQKYPFLTNDMEIGVKGAERQRPVGRYKLDSRGTKDFSDHYDVIWKAAREHIQDLENSFDAGRDSYNLFLIHSLGGGTGSGTFPLLATVLDQVGEAIQGLYGIDIYTAGVGIIPRIDQDPEVVVPKGQSIYFPNAYASLRDLEQLVDADTNPRDIPIYSRSFGRGGRRTDIDDSVESSFTGNSLPVDRTPFSNYWLVGVEEDLIMGGGGHTGIENYTDMVDNRVAESIHSLAQMEESVENWATDVNGLATTGAVGQTELRVPHEEVRNYCEMKRSVDDKRHRVDEEIPDEIESIREDIAYVETIKSDPSEIDPERENVDDPEEFVRGRLEQDLGVGTALVSGNTSEDVEATLSAIEEEFGAGMLLLAAEELDEMLQHPSAFPAVKDHWQEVIDRQWEGWNMNSKSEFGGADVRTYDGKEGALEEYFDQTITEYEREIEATEPGLLDKIPPVVSLTESTREEYQRWLDNLQNSQEDLLSANERYERVAAMVEVTDAYHRQAKEQLDQRMADLNADITDLEEEQRELEREIQQLKRSIDDEEERLTDDERAGQRLAILPLQAEALEDLTLERVENELNSLDDYVGEFIAEEDVRVGMNKWMDNSLAWEDPVIEMDMTGVDAEPPSRQELWILFHEDNEAYPNEYISQTIGANTRFAGQSELGYTGDPYSIQFVSFYNRGPVEGLSLFQRLEQMRESGMLDSMAGKFGDHRISFAYPEWYDRDVAKWFDISRELTLPRPPELDVERVDKPEYTEGEKRNYVKTNGLDAYIWHGTMWEDYEYGEDAHIFDGWERQIEGLTFRQLQQATPDEDLKARWLAGQADWEDVVDAYAENLTDREGLDITFADPEDVE